MRYICGIVNYNNGGSLVPLIKAVLEDQFDEVYVLDDASTDDTLYFLREFVEDITLVAGETNLGPAGNRNRILEYVKDDDIIFFIDADMELHSKENVGVLRRVFANNKIHMLGGLILDKSGQPMRYNYGSITTRRNTFMGNAYEFIARVVPKSTRRKLKTKARKYTSNLDVSYGKPYEHEVETVAEALFAIRGDVFAKLRGFDTSLRYHEGVDLSYRAKKLEGKTMFVPDIEARHLEGKVRENKSRDRRVSKRALYKKMK